MFPQIRLKGGSAVYLKTFDDIVRHLTGTLQEGDLVVTMVRAISGKSPMKLFAGLEEIVKTDQPLAPYTWFEIGGPAGISSSRARWRSLRRWSPPAAGEVPMFVGAMGRTCWWAIRASRAR